MGIYQRMCIVAHEGIPNDYVDSLHLKGFLCLRKIKRSRPLEIINRRDLDNADNVLVFRKLLDRHITFSDYFVWTPNLFGTVV